MIFYFPCLILLGYRNRVVPRRMVKTIDRGSRVGEDNGGIIDHNGNNVT